MRYVFYIPKAARRRVEEWAKEQDAKCALSISGALTFTFTPTAIAGIIITKVKHANGAELNLTGY